MLNDKELVKLGLIFREINDRNLAMYAANTFVTACYLHQSGEVGPSIKLLTSLFNYIGRNNRSTLIKRIFKNIKGNESELAKSVSANIEVEKIFSR